MAAEWVEGTSLRQILDRDGKSPSMRPAIAASICEALDYIHTRGAAHRDLKPENIIVAATTASSCSISASLPEAAPPPTFGKFSRIMGTADYISPEQLQGKRGDAQSDLYALGVILLRDAGRNHALRRHESIHGDEPAAHS